MLPDTELSSGFGSKDEPQPDGRPTAAFLSHSDIQAVQALEIQSAGSNLFDNRSSTVTTQIDNFNINIMCPDPASDPSKRAAPKPTRRALSSSAFIFALDVLRIFRSKNPPVAPGKQQPQSASGDPATVSDYDPSEPPVRTIDIKDIDTSLQLPASMSTPTPAESYVRDLIFFGHGLPCYDPRPRQAEIKLTGVRPGDVGTYSVNGGFRKTFNLWDAEEVIKGMVLARSGGSPYAPLGGSPGVEVDEIPEGRKLSKGAECFTRPPSPSNENGVVYEFSLHAPEGGILAVLSSADNELTSDKEAMRDYIIQNAEPIYLHAHSIRRIGPGDSLYVITDSIKTDASARAAYQPIQSSKTPRSLQLSCMSRLPWSKYRWGRQPPSTQLDCDRSDVKGKKILTLFLRGFKLAFSQQFVERMKTGLSVTAPSPPGVLPESHSADGRGNEPPSSRNTPPRSNETRLSRDGPGAARYAGAGASRSGKGETTFGTGESTSGGTQEGAYSGLVTAEGVGGVTYSQFPPSFENQVYHPSDIINELLLKMTAADLVLSHDDDWRHAFRDYGDLEPKDDLGVTTDCPDSSDIERNGPSIEEGSRLAIVLQNGVAYVSTPPGQVHSIDSQHNPTEVNGKLVDHPSNSPEGSQPSINTGVLEAMQGEGSSKQTRDGDVPPTSLNSPPLLNLPCEILSQIILPLPVPDILRSQAACSSLKSFITSSVEIQYRIALEISGLEDNKSCSSFSTLERLNRLAKAQKAWQSFKPQFTTTFTDPSPAHTSVALEGGALLRFGRRTSGIDYAALPLEKEEDMQWGHIDSAGGCFNACLCTDERDLVVTPKSTGIEGGTFDITLHLRQISTGLPHPQAEQPVLLASKGEYLEPDDTRIQINGDNLAVLLRYWQRKASLPDRVLVFEWKTGMLKASLEGNRSYCALGFLEENLLVLPNIQHGTLGVWDISLTASVPPMPAPICTLKLPDLAPGASFSRIMCNLQMTQAQHLQKPYRCSVEDYIISFSAQVVDTDGHLQRFPFFVHRKSLLQVIKNLRRGQERHSSTAADSPCDGTPLPSIIAWEQWGQKITRWIVTKDNMAGRNWHSAGQRTVYRAGRSILVMDFNPWSVKKCRYMLMEKRHEAQGEGEERHDGVQTQQSPTEVAGRFDESELLTSRSVAKGSASTDKNLVAEGNAGSEDGSGSDENPSASQGRAPRTFWTLPETSIVDPDGGCFLSPVKSELPCVCYKTEDFPNYDYIYMDEERIVGLGRKLRVREGEPLNRKFDVHYFG